MKSFQSFISEEKKRPVRVTNNPTGQTITNLPGGNIPDEQKFSQLERIAKQKSSKSVAAADDVSVQMRTQAADTAARAKETGPAQRRPLGDTTKGGPVKTMRLGDPGAPSKEAAKTLDRMRTADPVTTKRLQSNLSRSDAAKQAAARRARLSATADKALRDIRFDAKRTSPGARRTLARMSAAVDKTRAADKALADKATEALKQIRADSKPPTTAQLIKQTQQKPPTAPKPPTVTKPTLPTFASKGQTALPGVEKVKPGSRTLRGSAAQVNKPAPITKADVVRQSNTAVADAAKQTRASSASRLKGFLRGAGYVGAGLEAAGEYKRRKDMGQDTATAAAGSGTRVAGGATGAKLAAGLAAKTLSPLALAPFPGARPLYALGVGAAGVGGYTLGADWATKGFDYAKQNFKGFQDKANKAYQRLLLPKYRTKTEEFVPEEVEFTVEFVQRLKDFTAPVTNNPTVKAVTNNPVVRGLGRFAGGVEKVYLGGARLGALYRMVSPEMRPSQKVNAAITAFAPPGVAHISNYLTPDIDKSKFIRKNIDEPIIRSNKKIDKALGEPFTPGTSRNPNYPRIYRDMQKSGMPMF
jgi:hypothetical protein